jgi:hypothetical protein
VHVCVSVEVEEMALVRLHYWYRSLVFTLNGFCAVISCLEIPVNRQESEVRDKNKQKEEGHVRVRVSELCMSGRCSSTCRAS